MKKILFLSLLPFLIYAQTSNPVFTTRQDTTLKGVVRDSLDAYFTESATNPLLDLQRRTSPAGLFLRITPTDTDIPPFTMSTNESGSGAGGHPNYLMRMGFNTLGEKSAFPDWFLQMESNWLGDYNGRTNHTWSELHLDYFSVDGTEQRPWGIIKSQTSGWTNIGYNADNWKLTNRANTTTALDWFETGTDTALLNLYPTLTDLLSNSSYLLSSDNNKFYSLAQRDSNWLMQGGLSLLKWGSYVFGSCIWLNPNTQTITTRLGQSLILFSTSTNQQSVIMTSNKYTNSDMNIRFYNTFFEDTLGNDVATLSTYDSTFAIKNIESDNYTLSGGLYSLAKRTSTHLGTLTDINSASAQTQTKIGNSAVIYSNQNNLKRFALYPFYSDSVNSEITLKSNYIIFQDKDGSGTSTLFNTATKNLTLGSTDSVATGDLFADDIYADSIISDAINTGAFYINGILQTGEGSIGNADSLGGVPASGYLVDADSTQFRTFSDLKYAATASFAIAPALLDDSIAVKMNRSEMTGYTTDAEFATAFETLVFPIPLMDTILVGRLPGYKIPANITITEIASYTDAGTVSFNIEECGETTPNSAGTDAMASDLVADTDQQESTTFSNADFAIDSWMVLTISNVTGDPSIFSVSIRYTKQ
jgi:hypothetical protein